MKVGYIHSDVYDRESDYWRDIEDSVPSANSTEQKKNNDDDIVTQSNGGVNDEEK